MNAICKHSSFDLHGSFGAAFQLLRHHRHQPAPKKKVLLMEPKSDEERAKLGLPLREPWFEVKPFDEKQKNFVLHLKDALQNHSSRKMEVSDLAQVREELDLVKSRKHKKLATYLRKFSTAFNVSSSYTHNNEKKTWCSFTAESLQLLQEEAMIFEQSEAFFMEKLRKLLMISATNRLPFHTVKELRRSLGLPVDFKDRWVSKYPDVFGFKQRKGYLYLELISWDENLAVSAAERHVQEGHGNSTPAKEGGNVMSASNAVCASGGENYVSDALMETKHEQGDFSASEGEDCDSGALMRTEHEQGGLGMGNGEVMVREVEVEYLQNGRELHSDASNVIVPAIDSDNMQLYKPDTSNLQKQLSQANMLCTECMMQEPFPGVKVEECKENAKISNHGTITDPEETLTKLDQLHTALSAIAQEALCSSDLEGEVDGCNRPACYDVDTKMERESCHRTTTTTPTVSKLENEYSQPQSLAISKSNVLAGNGEHCVAKASCLNECHEGSHRSFALVRFPWKNKRQPSNRGARVIEAFQTTPYVSPYKNARDLQLPDHKMAADKFAVAVIHEFLNLTLEKRATVQQLERLRRPYHLPKHLLEFLLRYDGIFYVVKGTTKTHVFLKEAYNESILIEKHPLVLWQERFVVLAFINKMRKKSEAKKRSSPHTKELC